MQDLNFFSTYNSDNNGKNGVDKYFVGGVGVLAAAVIVSIGMSMFKIMTAEFAIKKYNAALNEPTFQTQLTDAENINQRLSLLENYEKQISQVSNDVKKINVVTDDLLTDISGAMPQEVSLKDFSINGYEVSIKGNTTQKTAIAEFEHNLKGVSKLKNVFVNEVPREETINENYSFQITCILKEVR